MNEIRQSRWQQMKVSVFIVALFVVANNAAEAQQFKLGVWNVTHKKDRFEETYSISTAAPDQDKKLDLILSCDSGKDFRISFLGELNSSYGFPTNGTRAMLLIEGDDTLPSIPVLTEPNRIPFMLNADHANAAERVILNAHKLGIRVKATETKHQDYFFILGDAAPARALIMKICPPPPA